MTDFGARYSDARKPLVTALARMARDAIGEFYEIAANMGAALSPHAPVDDMRIRCARAIVCVALVEKWLRGDETDLEKLHDAHAACNRPGASTPEFRAVRAAEAIWINKETCEKLQKEADAYSQIRASTS